MAAPPRLDTRWRLEIKRVKPTSGGLFMPIGEMNGHCGRSVSRMVVLHSHRQGGNDRSVHPVHQKAAARHDLNVKRRILTLQVA